MTNTRNVRLGILLVTTLLLCSAIISTHMNVSEIGLRVLSWYKSMSGKAVNLPSIKQPHTPPMEHHPWTALLAKYVTPNGKVNYQGFIQDRAALEQYLTDLSDHPPGQNWNEAAQLAYWINAYNAFTVKLIIDHYPLKSIKDIADGWIMVDSPWDIKFFQIGGTEFDLNTIEHDILRKQFDEPRIHFAINCASFSCPKLRHEAYTVDQLAEQLEDQTRAFLHNLDKNVITAQETQLSQIFHWFQSDFERHATLSEFIQRYHSSINPTNRITYLDYNWALNE